MQSLKAHEWIISNEKGSIICCKEEQARKVLYEIDFKEERNNTFFNEVQFMNAFSSMNSTFNGIVISSKELQPLNVPFLITNTVFGRTTFLSDVQLLNEPFFSDSIEVTVESISI